VLLRAQSQELGSNRAAVGTKEIDVAHPL
jgi:hypothetical protein